ncbi:MAG: hypothetical protein HUK22_06430, partial [Thermoguttaceae bacterium]|nr:hypothetical protein [Thermoguttaceae bacterium]
PMVNAGILREYDADGRQLREFPVSGAPVCALRLKNGDTLTGAGSAIERFDADGKLVWKFDCVADGGLKPGVLTAVSLLKNGNVLIGYYQSDPETPDVVEVSADKKIVWTLTLPETALVAAVQLLDDKFKPSKEVVER